MNYLLSLLILSGLLSLFGGMPAKQQLTLKVLDVGQGDSIYIRLPSHEDIIIDGGPSDRLLAQIGLSMPITDRKIELIIVSHNHADHIGGIDAILNRYDIDEIWLSGAIHTTDQYLRLLQTIKDRGISTKVVWLGTEKQFNESKLTVVHPLSDMTGQQPDDQHHATIVFLLRFRNFCALLTGDIDTEHEATIIDMAKKQNINLACNVLKVTHHGSAYGTSQAWLDTVKPEIALIPVGNDNRYGHPAPAILQRLAGFGIPIYRTDMQGAITVTSNGQNFWTRTDK